MKKRLRLSEFKRFLQDLAPEETNFDGSAYILRRGEKRYIVEPPFPPKNIFPPRPTLLQEQLESKPSIAVILLHYGEYAIGLFEGTELVMYKTGKHFIRGKTRAGGQSAGRYSRIRTGQRAEFLDGVCFAATVLLGQRIGSIDYIFFGGARETGSALMKACPLLQKAGSKVSNRTINARHADFETLRTCIEDVWSFGVEEVKQQS